MGQVTDLTTRYIQTPPNTTERAWIVHHTVTNSPTTMQDELTHLDNIDRYHRDQRGFSMGIGYHAVVFPSGNGYKVGNYGTSRAHIKDKNHLYLGLALVGNFTREAPTSAAIATAKDIISGSKRPLADGHKNLSPPGYTECPGTWDYVTLLTDIEPQPVGPYNTIINAKQFNINSLLEQVRIEVQELTDLAIRLRS